MNDDTYRAVKEICGALFYALLGQADDQHERECVEILNGAVEAGCVRHPDARAILSGIVRSSKAVEPA
jgi:hypothetical protein